METKYTYTMQNSPSHFDYNDTTKKFQLKGIDAEVEIQEGANDLRYCGWGIQPIWVISICLPCGNIGKTLKRTDDSDFSKVMEYVNKKLKKAKFKTVDFAKDAVQYGASPRIWWIKKIQKTEGKLK